MAPTLQEPEELSDLGLYSTHMRESESLYSQEHESHETHEQSTGAESNATY